MQAIVHQLGELFLQAVPTVVIVLIFYIIMRVLFFVPLMRVMDEREARKIAWRANLKRRSRTSRLASRSLRRKSRSVSFRIHQPGPPAQSERFHDGSSHFPDDQRSVRHAFCRGKRARRRRRRSQRAHERTLQMDQLCTRRARITLGVWQAAAADLPRAFK